MEVLAARGITWAVLWRFTLVFPDGKSRLSVEAGIQQRGFSMENLLQCQLFYGFVTAMMQCTLSGNRCDQ